MIRSARWSMIAVLFVALAGCSKPSVTSAPASMSGPPSREKLTDIQGNGQSQGQGQGGLRRGPPP